MDHLWIGIATLVDTENWVGALKEIFYIELEIWECPDLKEERLILLQ
jgi:hypothetical protein